MAKLDLKGKKFGRLTTIEECGKDDRKQILWLCECECGNKIKTTAYRLNKGKTRSCGCLMSDINKKQAKILGENNKTHGLSNSRIYKTYRGIKDRCLNHNDMHYSDYGGRGVYICEEWLGDNGFVEFYSWAMCNGYDDSLTIDRIDVNGNYDPSNCRWVNLKTQANNKRRNRFIEYNGEIKTLAQWSDHFGINRVTLAARMDRCGMSFEEVISEKSYKLKKYKVIDISAKDEFIMTREDMVENIEISISNIRHYTNKDKLYKGKYKIIKL